MRQIIFGSTPSLCSFRSDGSIFKIDFVSNNDELNNSFYKSEIGEKALPGSCLGREERPE